MGLFDKIMGSVSEKKTDKNSKNPEFESFIIECENVSQEVKRIASANSLSLSQLGFKVLKVRTLYKTSKDKEWVEADEEKIKHFRDSDFLLNPELKIKQTYKIDIFKKIDGLKINPLPPMTIAGNKELTKIIINVRKNSAIQYFSKIESQTIEKIERKKIKAGILVRINDDLMIKGVKDIISDIRVNGTITKESTFVVCEGIASKKPIDDSFIYHYKKKSQNKDDQGRIDYSKRGFILAVPKGDCIMEYIKPQKGTAGRDCRGKYIAVSEPKIENETVVKHTENIIKKEDEERIKYIANRNGYVTHESSGVYDIQENMEVDEVSFKTTGSIETDMSAEVKINITQSDVFKDAIGPGINVQTYELNIGGNVASGAKIKTEKLHVGGQTHQTSIIESKSAQIAIHRGLVTADEVEIDRLEGGKIIGNIVHVKQAIGGEIIGKNIVIDELSSNVSITASDTIEIKNLRGSNNKLLIDPSLTKEHTNNMEKINKDKSKLSRNLKQTAKILDEKKKTIEKTKSIVKMVQKKILELKSEGKNPSPALLGKINEFQVLVKDYNDLLKKYKDDKIKLKNMVEDLERIQNKVFSAKIINHSAWKEYNEIKFRLISPSVEKIYNTKENEIIRVMTLIQKNEGDYEIKKSMEYEK